MVSDQSRPTITCESCGDLFTSVKNMKRHQATTCGAKRTKHVSIADDGAQDDGGVDGANYDAICDVCDKWFRRDQLKSHQRQHHFSSLDPLLVQSYDEMKLIVRVYWVRTGVQGTAQRMHVTVTSDKEHPLELKVCYDHDFTGRRLMSTNTWT